MTMKTHQILCRHTGEISYTAKDPVAIFTGQVDLEETTTCILSSDDFRLVSTKLWEVRSVELPDWLSPEEWIGSTVQWKYTWGFGVDTSWPESWQRGLKNLCTTMRLACVKLLKVKNFRSKFRESLRDQLVTWLETAPESRQFDDPFSRRQWDALLTDRNNREAKQLSEYLYRCR
jgi:hypothetical protein